MENSNSHFYKKNFLPAEREECFTWFESHMDRLPKELKIDKSMTTKDLPVTVKRLMTMLKCHYRDDSSVCNGYLSNLLLIRDLVRKQPGWTD